MARSRVVGCSRSIVSMPTTISLQTPSQSAESAFSTAVMRPYPKSVEKPLDGLTDGQRAAALDRGGPLLVLGAAGSGKTQTLLARYVSIVDDGAAPEELLVLALSRSAADELRQRVDEALDRPYEELHVHSVEGWCERLLADEALA